MKRILIPVAAFLILHSCSPRLYPSRTETVEHTVTVTEIVHDSIVQVQPDSSIVQALIQCDSAGRARIEEIRTLKESARIQQSMRLADNILTSHVQVDSMGIYLTYKDRYHDTAEVRTIETVIEKPVNRLTWYQKTLLLIGLLTMLILLPLILFKLSKKFMV